MVTGTITVHYNNKAYAVAYADSHRIERLKQGLTVSSRSPFHPSRTISMSVPSTCTWQLTIRSWRSRCYFSTLRLLRNRTSVCSGNCDSKLLRSDIRIKNVSTASVRIAFYIRSSPPSSSDPSASLIHSRKRVR